MREAVDRTAGVGWGEHQYLTLDETWIVADCVGCATLYIAAQEIGHAGSVDEPCRIRIEMHDDEVRWEYIEDNVLIRSGMRELFFE
jgi:hypothetical protein